MNDRWSKTIIALHWISAALVVGLVVVGFVMVDLPAEAPLRRVLGRVHSLSGLTLGTLTLGRFLVRMIGKNPAPIPLAPMHRKGVSVVHALIYVALFGMGASGVGTALGSSWPAYVGGEAPAPVLEGLLSRQVHGALIFGLLLLVAAHVVGAVVQQLRQGRTLRRMLPFLP